MKYSIQYLALTTLALLSPGRTIEADSNELLAPKSPQEKIAKHVINYEDFKNVCDVLFIHTESPAQHFDPTWFRPRKEGKNGTQKILSLVGSCDPSLVQPGDLVFVRRAKPFLEKVHPFIQHPYIIITHGNSSSRFQRSFIEALNDPKIIAWFSIHTGNKAHPKLHPLPLGIRQSPVFLSNGKKSSLDAFFKEIRKASYKKYLLYMNFLDRTHAERETVKRLFEHKPFCLHEDKVDFEAFMNHIAQSKFTLAPRGKAPADSFRIWESLAVGSIPIVKKSKFMDRSLYDQLPVLIIDTWESVTEDFLKETYKKIKSMPYAPEKLYMRYWLDKIFKVRDDFLQKNKLTRNDAHKHPVL